MLATNDAVARSRDAGSSLARFLLYWNRVATAEPSDPADPNDPAYDWGLVDDQVQAAVANGLQPVLDFRSAPLWAQGPGGDLRGTVSPAAAALAAFARAAATRYHGVVHYWEIWNEPNSRAFLRPQRDSEGRALSPTLYRALVNAAAGALHGVDSANVVIAGETAAFSGAGGLSPLSFLRQFFKGTVEADVVSHHPYTFGSPWRHAMHPDDASLGDLSKWAGLVRAAVASGHVVSHDGTPKTDVALWVSELSWDSSPPDPKGVPARLLARWTSEALYRSWSAGAGAVIWGQLRDYPLTTGSIWGIYQSGFYTYADAPKLALASFRFPFVAYAKAGRLSVWGRTPAGVSGAVVIQRKTASGWRKVRVLNANGVGIFRAGWPSIRTAGLYRASAGTVRSLPFSLNIPPERYASPFGCGGPVSC
jgi:cellulase (glycosyl hydrolase family 5)